MKKTLITLALIFATFFNLTAQEILNAEKEGNGYIDSWKQCIQSGLDYIKSGSIDNKAVDFQVNWDKRTNFLELEFGANFNSYGYATLDLGHRLESGYRLYSYKLGLGLQERYVNGPILLQAKCFPYLEFYELGVGSGPKLKKGFCTQFEAGIKMFKISDVTSVFLTIGYELDAPKFKVNKMFKEENGKWTCGLSFIW